MRRATSRPMRRALAPVASSAWARRWWGMLFWCSTTLSGARRWAPDGCSPSALWGRSWPSTTSAHSQSRTGRIAFRSGERRCRRLEEGTSRIQQVLSRAPFFKPPGCCAHSHAGEWPLAASSPHPKCSSVCANACASFFSAWATAGCGGGFPRAACALSDLLIPGAPILERAQQRLLHATARGMQARVPCSQGCEQPVYRRACCLGGRSWLAHVAWCPARNRCHDR